MPAELSIGMTKNELMRWSTEELESALDSNTFDRIQKRQAERILREREREPDRKRARRSYSIAAWTLAYSVGTFVVTLILFWLIATGNRLP
jgi:hypothetical protein